MHELSQLWNKLIGEPPAPEQFGIWEELYPGDIIRKAILKTGIKNQNLGGTMTQDHRLRFANRVMQMASKDAAEHAANRERLHAEMSGGKL
jgi:hypothetical protein